MNNDYVQEKKIGDSRATVLPASNIDRNHIAVDGRTSGELMVMTMIPLASEPMRRRWRLLLLLLTLLLLLLLVNGGRQQLVGFVQKRFRLVVQIVRDEVLPTASTPNDHVREHADQSEGSQKAAGEDD